MPKEEVTMNQAQMEALKEFAKLHGDNWKSELSMLWQSGKDSGILRQIRNNYLPLVLSKKFKLEV
jgi:hypothetical protein